MKYVKALAHKNVGGEGFGHISVGQGWMFVKNLTVEDREELLQTGMLFVVEAGFEAAASTGELATERIVQNLVRVGQSVLSVAATLGV